MIYVALNIERYIYFRYQSMQYLINRQGGYVERKEQEYWEKIRKEFIERFCKAALHEDDEDQIKHMKQCMALIGDL